MRQSLAILGASNVANAYSRIVRGFFPTQVATKLFVAAGHGRAYGTWSSVVYRALPSILDCGLWAALDDGECDDRAAIVTDVGNDLIYGQEPQTILNWVAECCSRLRDRAFRLTIVLPPRATLRNISRFRFRVVRSIFFPGSPLTFENAMRGVEELTAGLQQMAVRYEAKLIDPPADWYAFDPVHIRRAVRSEAWCEILASTELPAIPDRLPRVGSVPFRPHFGRYWGKERHRQQPSIQRPNLEVSVY